MIRGLGAETTSTYSQTLNWYEVRLADLEPGIELRAAQWATLGKQDWRCGMNRTPG
jgi:hypothetical protein